MRNIFMIGLFSLTTSAFAQVEVSDVMVKIPPGGQGNGVAYFTLKNTSKKDVALVGAKTKAAEAAELHESMSGDHMTMKMEPVSSIEIKAGGEAVLKPGGYHVMLIGLKPGLKIGNNIPMTLSFSDGEKKQVEAKAQGF